MEKIEFTCRNCGITIRGDSGEFKIKVDDGKRKTHQLEIDLNSEYHCLDDKNIIDAVRMRVKEHNDNKYFWQKHWVICELPKKIKICEGFKVIEEHPKSTIQLNHRDYHYIECPVCDCRHYFMKKTDM